MPTFRKSGRGWRAEIYRKGIRRSKIFETKSAAQAWAGQTEAEIIAGSRGEIPNLAFADLLDRYSREVSASKKGARWEQIRIAMLRRDPVAQVRLRKLDAADVAAWRDRRLQSVSGASVRREWNLLSHACNIAVREWRWLKENPFQGVRRPKSPRSRDRLISDGDLERLQAVATTPTRRVVLSALRFAIETGMRAGELCGLERINATTARLQDTKNGTSREVPLSPEAIAIWEAHGPFGITPASLDAIWRKMTKEAGIVDLHWHDSRHTAITRLSQKLNVLQLARMVGIKDLRVLSIYFNESAADIAKKL